MPVVIKPTKPKMSGYRGEDSAAAEEYQSMVKYAEDLAKSHNSYAKGGAVGMKKKGYAKGGKVQKMAGGGMMMKKKGYAKGGMVGMKKKGMAKGGKVK